MGTAYMILLLRFSIGYLILSILVVLLFRENVAELLINALATTGYLLPGFALVTGALLLLIFGLTLLRFVTAWRPVVEQVIIALVGMIMFQLALTLMKSSIPYIIPFYADPYFAPVDRLLHLGTDPWVAVHGWDAYLPLREFVPAYFSLWAIPAVCLPVIIAATDRDPGRIRRFIILYLISWAVVGNFLALCFSSVGPVYFDRFYGGERFADLIHILDSSDLKHSAFRVLQERLWDVYEAEGQAVGSGISAFPSVHVSLATLTAIYTWERSFLLFVPTFLFAAAVMILSVYTGYHYAIDGYFSILFVTGCWWWLRRRSADWRGSDAMS